MERVIRPGLTVGQPICKAALDLACYDLAGRREGRPVIELLGGATSGPLQLGWTVASPDLERVEAQLEQGLARGYRSFNFKVGPPQTPRYDLDLTRMVRRYAPGGFLWADANTGYDLTTAEEMLPKLADEGVDVIESPLPPLRIRGYQALKRQGALPIFMDEGIISAVEAEEFIALDMLDGITLKVGRSGGLWRSKQIVDLVRERGLRLLGSGLSDPDLSLAASVHLFAYAGITEPCALNGPQYLAGTLADTDFLPQADLIEVPRGPGLGLSMGQEAQKVLTTMAEGEHA
jgi:L-alanine-DL-glutamate epimerase-like enolase superfamily enzyme